MSLQLRVWKWCHLCLLPSVVQDTLCALSGRQYYQDCKIYGYVDFIFGNAAAVFQGCTIHVILNKKNGPGIIMASGRGSADDRTGLIFKDGRILPYKPGASAYLGRPWKGYSRMVYINTYMDNVSTVMTKLCRV